jgi:protein-tyrosine phosphatase
MGVTGTRPNLVRAQDNTRDLGGLPCRDGVLRPGLVWRGAVHDLGEPTLVASTPGPWHFFDLRHGGEARAAPSAGVCHHSWPLDDPARPRSGPKGTGYFVASAIRLLPALSGCVEDLLATLARREPVFVGCRLGKDRTGLVVLVLGALLGVCRDALVRDYTRTARSFVDCPDWVAGYALRRGEDVADVRRRLSPSAEIPRGILSALPDDPEAATALLGVRADTVRLARERIIHTEPSEPEESR